MNEEARDYVILSGVVSKDLEATLNLWSRHGYRLAHISGDDVYHRIIMERVDERATEPEGRSR